MKIQSNDGYITRGATSGEFQETNRGIRVEICVKEKGMSEMTKAIFGKKNLVQRGTDSQQKCFFCQSADQILGRCPQQNYVVQK